MGRPRSESARVKMVAAAAEILFEIGLASFSIDEVVRRSGVAKSTVYRHFPERTDLILAAIEGTVTRPPTPDTGSLRGDLELFLVAVAPIFADPALRALSHELMAASLRDPANGNLAATFFRGRMGPLHTIYRNAVDRGEIPASVDFETAVELIEGPLMVLSMMRPERLVDLDPHALIDRIDAQLDLYGNSSA